MLKLCHQVQCNCRLIIIIITIIHHHHHSIIYIHLLFHVNTGQMVFPKYSFSTLHVHCTQLLTQAKLSNVIVNTFLPMSFMTYLYPQLLSYSYNNTPNLLQISSLGVQTYMLYLFPCPLHLKYSVYPLVFFNRPIP